MTWQQFLTEKVLGECWNIYVNFNDEGMCQKCGDPAEKHAGNRTYDNRNDLMDSYEKIEKDGKWDEFFWVSASHCKPTREGLGCSEATAWLFCLDQKDYEYRCKMVAEFYGWGEQRDPVIDKNSGAYGDN